MTKVRGVDIHWHGHDSFRVEADGKVIYIDPWQLGDAPQADLILVTHDHSDHCSPEDIAKIQGRGDRDRHVRRRRGPVEWPGRVDGAG